MGLRLCAETKQTFCNFGKLYGYYNDTELQSYQFLKKLGLNNIREDTITLSISQFKEFIYQYIEDFKKVFSQTITSEELNYFDNNIIQLIINNEDIQLSWG